MTAIEYEQKTGCNPSVDDLERVNCADAGITSEHSMCGWCRKHDKPRFMCGCEVKSFIDTSKNDDKKNALIKFYVDAAAHNKQRRNDDRKKTLLEFYAGRPAKEIINADDLQDMISIVMNMADTTSDRGLKRYLFNAIDSLGAAYLYLQKYPASAKLSEFWQKHPFNDEMNRV